MTQMQPFGDLTIPGQDLLFGFMDENITLAALGTDENSVFN